jgi:hypothetical protein
LQRAFQSVLLDPLIKNVTNGLMSAFSGTDIGSSLIGKFFSGTLFGGASSAATGAEFGTTVTAAGTTFAGEVTTAGTAFAAAVAGASATGAAGSAVGGVAGAAGAGGGFFSWLGTLLPKFEHGGIVPSAQGGWRVPSLGSGGILARLHSQGNGLAGERQQHSAIDGGVGRWPPRQCQLFDVDRRAGRR